MEREQDPDGPRSTSKSQRISILRKAFDVYDVDGSGAIDYAEFRKLLQDLGWPSHEEFLNRAVRVLDQDLSGEIEFSEFMKWTEFAYASRILYRHDMYGIGPRYAPNDEASFQSIGNQSQDGMKGYLMRRSSLSTVFEEGEGVSRGTCQDAGDSSDENVSEIDGGMDLTCRSNTGSNSNDIEHALSCRTSAPRFRDRDPSPSKSRRSIKFRDQPEIEETKKSEKDEPDEKETKGRDISTSVKEMASMVLSPCRRGMRVHTSRSRSKSAGLLNDRRSGRRDRSTSRGPTDISKLGPRTESKVTVRLRWACGQFGNAVIGDENQSESISNNGSNENSDSKGGEKARVEESMKRSISESQGMVVEDPVRHAQRHSGHMEKVDKGGASENYNALQEVSVDLRRTRSE